MMYSIVEFKMMVLEELPSVLSSTRRIFVTAASLDYKMLQLILFDFVQKGQYFVCVGGTVEKVVGRSFDFITAGAKKIEAVLKVMLKLVLAKMAQAQT